MIGPESLSKEARKIFPDGCDPHGKLKVSDDGVVLEAFVDGEITVDRLLDNIDLKLNWYIPSKFAIEFMIFIRMALGEEPENSNPKAHYFFMDCIFQQPNVEPFFVVRNIDYEELKNRVVILATREFAKSVLISYLVLFMAAKGEVPGFGRVNYGLYVADSMRNNVETTMKTIRSVYNESKYLRSLFEETRLIQTEVNFVRKPRTKKEIELYTQHVTVEKQPVDTVPGRMKRTFTLVGLGASTGGRGSRDGLARPDFSLFDDMIPSESEASSETILHSVESTIDADILPGMNNNKNFAIMIGTPYSKKDPVYSRVEEGSWLPVVFPRAEKIYAGMKEEDFVSVWEDRHSFKNCMRDFKRAQRSKDKGNKEPMRKLMQEHYLRISNDEDRMITDDMIQWYKRSNLEKHLYNMNLYATTDFTTTGAEGSDKSGMAMWAHSSNGDFFMLDLALRKMEMIEQYDSLFRSVEYYSPKTRGIEAGVETDGQQKSHIYSLQEGMIKRNIWFTIARQKGAKPGSIGIRSGSIRGSKFDRFRMMLPYFQNRKIWFPEELRETADMRELLEELEYVTYTAIGSKFDDGLDLISQLVLMNTIMPAESASSVEKISSAGRNDRKWTNILKQDDSPSAYSSYIS